METTKSLPQNHNLQALLQEREHRVKPPWLVTMVVIPWEENGKYFGNHSKCIQGEFFKLSTVRPQKLYEIEMLLNGQTVKEASYFDIDI